MSTLPATFFEHLFKLKQLRLTNLVDGNSEQVDALLWVDVQRPVLVRVHVNVTGYRVRTWAERMRNNAAYNITRCRNDN